MLLNSQQQPVFQRFPYTAGELLCAATVLRPPGPSVSRLIHFSLAVAVTLFSTHRLLGAEGWSTASPTLARIEAGLTIDDSQTGRWNRLILLARPRIASGDVDSLSAAVRDSVSKFVLTIMASVEQREDPTTEHTQFRLEDIGVGYSTLVAGELTSVTVADAAKIGAKLGLYDRMTLAENEKQLGKVKVSTRTATLVIIDAPAFVLRGSHHQPYVMRHFVWVDPRTGRTAALVWLIERDAQDRPVVETEQPPRWASAGLREDRAIHVDGSQFNILGIPNERAFAIEKMPPGKPIPWSEEAQALAALDNYDAAALRSLSAALNAMLQASVEKNLPRE